MGSLAWTPQFCQFSPLNFPVLFCFLSLLFYFLFIYCQKKRKFPVGERFKLFSLPFVQRMQKYKAGDRSSWEGWNDNTIQSLLNIFLLLFIIIIFSLSSFAPRGGHRLIMIMFSCISISLADLPATKVNPKSQRGGHIHPCLWDSFSEITLSFLWNFPGSSSKK